ncbi:MAG TPA: hypothetical protein VHP61_04520 [Acidobacteriota bacterium]|nr:hypothetical protein [Acidobacteriota bacterium]
MKSSRAIVVAACFLQLACVSEEARRVRIGIPGYTPLPAGDVGDVYVTDFRVEKPPADFDIGKELVEYLYAELARKYEGRVFRRAVPADKAGLAGDRDFWSGLPAGPGPALFLTGTVLYREEVRKALLDTDPKEIDGPFRQEKKGLAERRLYSLTVGVSLIRAGTGEVVLSKEFNETATYPDANVPVSYAFYELSPHFKQKFFQTVFGEERLQERYLFTR